MSTDRKPKRNKACLVRMTEADLERLHQEAWAEGITLQTLAERRLLGYKDAKGQRPNGYAARQKEELPLTG